MVLRDPEDIFWSVLSGFAVIKALYHILIFWGQPGKAEPSPFSGDSLGKISCYNYPMTYILIILVFIVIVFYQSGRIAKVELDLKKLSQKIDQGSVPSGTTSTAASTAHPTPTVQSQVISSSGQIPSSSPAIPVKPPVSTPQAPSETPVTNEEASGRILGRIGIGAVIVGVAFFLKYAFDNNWIQPTSRVIIGLLIGILVMGIGQALRKKYLNYSDMLMGGGMAILYLAIYASYGFYHLVDPMTAFMGMIIVTAVGVIMSIMNATPTLSYIALIGGFITPFLIGVQVFGPFITFTYITILNAGMLGILLYKKWSPLVIVGLIGTWLHFGPWLATSYKDDLMVPTLLFILVQFLIFTASSIFRIIVEKLKASEVDYFVLGTTALSFAAACYSILMPQHIHYTSIGAILVAIFYGVVALVAYKENPGDRSINIFLPGLAVTFLTVAVPIEFSGPWIAAWWFAEALILYIVASNSSSRGFQVMGVVVYILGLVDLLWYLGNYVRPAGYVIFFNGPFMMLAMAVGVAYAIAFMYYRYGSISPDIQKRGMMVFIVVANVITLYALTTQVIAYYDLQQLSGGQTGYQGIRNMSNTTVSILWALYAALLTVVGFAKRYVSVRRMGLVLFIITAFKVVVDVWNLGEVYRIISFIGFGVIALVVSFIYVKYKDRL